MNWQLILLGFIDDPYTNHLWLLVLIAMVGTILCFYRYKTGWLIIPIVSVISLIFLRGFLEPENYQHITSLSHAMPRILTMIVSCFVAPIAGTYFGLQKHRKKNVHPEKIPLAM